MGYRARKDYVCPGCDGTIAPGQGHVVAWPEPFLDDRRHWHHHCWRDEVQRVARGEDDPSLG